MSIAITISRENYDWLYDQATKWQQELLKKGVRKKISMNRLVTELIELAKETKFSFKDLEV